MSRCLAQTSSRWRRPAGLELDVLITSCRISKILRNLKTVLTLKELGADFPSEVKEFTATSMTFCLTIGTPMWFEC